MKRRFEEGKNLESGKDSEIVPSKLRASVMESQDISPPAEVEPQPCSSASLIRENSASKNLTEPDSTVDTEPPFIFTGSLHPLLLPNVVRDIVRFLGQDDLKSSRVVCATWNEEACKVMQQTRTVTFLDNEAIRKYGDHFSSDAEIPPHAKYQFYNVELHGNKILEDFLRSFGHNIKTLILQQKIIPERELYRILHDHLPNLESIWLRSIPSLVRTQPHPELSLTNLSRQGHPMDLRSRLQRRFSAMTGTGPQPQPPQPEPEDTSTPTVYAFPNIRHFTIGSFNEIFLAAPAADGEADEAVNVNWAERSRPLVKFLTCLPNLTTVSLSTLDGPRFPQFSSCILRSLIDAGPVALRNLMLINFPIEFQSDALVQGLVSLRLQYLGSLDITLNPGVDSGLLKSLIEVSGGNLTKLSLTFQPNYPYGYNFIKLTGEHLNRLRSLSLTRFKWSLGFIESLTSLRTLSLCDMDLGPIFPVHFRSQHPNLESFKVSTTGGEQRALLNDPEVVCRITRAFPKLKVFHLPGATDECLRPIYTDLPFLEELNCTLGTFTDCGISGVPLEVCNDLVETQTFFGINADKFRCDLFIGNLTNMLHLSLDSDKMTDLAVLFGVIRCPKLRSLSLKSNQITDLAVESITDQMGSFIQSLDVLHCPGVTEAGRFFASERYPGRHFLAQAREEEPSTETRARLQHRFYDNFNRRKGFTKSHEVRTMIRHFRSGRNRRPHQLHYIQERIAELHMEIPPEQIVDLQRELLQLQQVHNELGGNLPPQGPDLNHNVPDPSIGARLAQAPAPAQAQALDPQQEQGEDDGSDFELDHHLEQEFGIDPLHFMEFLPGGTDSDSD